MLVTYNVGRPFIHPESTDWDVLACGLINEAGLMAWIKLAFPVLRNPFPDCTKNMVLLRKICDLRGLGSVNAISMGGGGVAYQGGCPVCIFSQ